MVWPAVPLGASLSGPLCSWAISKGSSGTPKHVWPYHVLSVHPSTSHNLQSTLCKPESRNAMSSTSGNSLASSKEPKWIRHLSATKVGGNWAPHCPKSGQKLQPRHTHPNQANPIGNCSAHRCDLGIKNQSPTHRICTRCLEAKQYMKWSNPKSNCLCFSHFTLSDFSKSDYIINICMKLILSGLLENYNLSAISIELKAGQSIIKDFLDTALMLIL